MNAVAKIRPDIRSVQAPAAIANLPGWLIWRYEQVEGEPKPRKVPYYTSGVRRHGVQGRPEDRNQLTTLEAAKAAAARKNFDGVGLALMPEFNIVALDFDHCLAQGGVHPDVERVIMGTYAEWSPSGEGVRAFFSGALGNNKAHGEPFGFETFSTKGFVTFTGNRLDVTDILGCESTVAPVTDEVRALCHKRFGHRESSNDEYDPLMSFEPTLGLTEQQIVEMLEVLDPDMPHKHWLDIGMAIHHETSGEAFHLWDSWSAQGAKYSSTTELLKRWDSFGSSTDRPVTARTLLKMARENGAYINDQIATAAEVDALKAEDVNPESLKFQVIPAGEFSRGKRPEWIVKGLIPRAELVVLFGESGSGKSFIALDIVAAIARGVEWRGLRVRKGRVVYVAAEGGGGFRNRLAAYQQHHGVDLDEAPLGIIHAAPNFLDKKDASEVVKAIKAGGPVDLVVIDTFAQVTPGANENASDDMGKALANCKLIHKVTGAAVVLIHHAGKDASKGARGWSGLRAAADAEMEVLRTATGRMLRVSKQKDGDDSGEWGFDLLTVPIGMDEDGDSIDSCVVVEAEVPVVQRISSKKPLGLWEKLTVEVVGEIALGQNSGIEVEEVIKEVAKRGPAPEDGKRDTRRQRARRALLAMCEGDEAPFFLEDGCISVL